MLIGENIERPVVARRSRCVRRVMYALFFDSDGILASVSVPENCSVTGTFYHDFVLSAVVNHYQAKCPKAGDREIKLLNDNDAGLGGSVGCAVRLETRRSRVQSPPKSATSFHGD